MISSGQPIKSNEVRPQILASLNLAIMLNVYPFLYKNYRTFSYFDTNTYWTGSGDAIYSYDFDGQTINYATSQLHYKICETFDEFEDGVIDTDLWSTSKSGNSSISESGGYIELYAGGNSGYAYLTGKPTKTVLSSSVKYCSFYCYFEVSNYAAGVAIYLTDGSNNVTLFSGGNEVCYKSFQFDCFYDPSEQAVYLYKNGVYAGRNSCSALSEMRIKFYVIVNDTGQTARLRCYFVRKQKPSPSSTITQYISSDDGTTYTALNEGYETTISNPGTQVKYKISYNIPSGEYVRMFGGGIFART